MHALLADDVSQLRVLVADSALLGREALRAALAAEAGISASAVGIEALLDSVTRTAPTVTVIVASLDPRDGLDACALLKDADVETRVVVVGTSADPELLAAAVEVGADGFVSFADQMDELADAVRRVAAGEASIPSGMLGGLLKHLIRRRREEDAVVGRFATLTRREQEVLALLADGLDQEAIATRLVVSKHTARTHVQNVLAKLDVHSRLEAVALVYQYDLFGRFDA
jgi:DNA-binding NarL/FixJ family response regulator